MDERAVADLQAGYALQQRGDLDAAEARYKTVLSRYPDNEFALNLLGVVALRRGAAKDAEKLIRAALRVNSQDAETHNNLGLALEALNDPEGAALAFQRSLALNPRQPVVLNNLGNVHAARNDPASAIGCYESALRLRSDYVECLGNLALSLLAVRRLDDAERAARRGLAIAPGNTAVRQTLARVLMASGRYDAARDCWASLLAEHPRLLDARIQLSIVYKQLRCEGQARELLEGVLAEDPDNTEAHKCLGVLREQTGDFEGAARAFREAIRTAPRHASAYYQLAKLTTSRLTVGELDSVRSMLADSETPRTLRGPLCFAMACELEKDGRYAESLEYFMAGNRARSDSVYDSAADDAYYCAVRDAPDGATDGRGADLPSLGFLPVFILGMPRSGTTLTEQILASHSDIRGAGESGALSDLALDASRLTGKPFPMSLPALTKDHLGRLRDDFRQQMVRLAGNGRFIVDKTPANFQLIGLIRHCFPEARILYCRRDPLDNCLSIFKLPFDETQTYSHDLESLGRYYRHHQRLMDIWLARYPDSILCVDYEETVRDLEAQARRILSFVGVPFEAGVLDFYEADRLILTPSAQQVRRPIYSSSIGVWRRYGQSVRPLAEALNLDFDSKEQAERRKVYAGLPAMSGDPPVPASEP